MHRTISTWAEFRQAWAGVHNFLIAGDVKPAAFAFPPVAQVVDELRRHPEAGIHPGTKDRTLLMTDYSATFRALPLDRALAQPFSLAHFHLSVFDRPGGCLHGFGEQVLRPWQQALAAQGFTYDRCYPILFISGPDSATNYHMDFSHVLAWQLHGTKRFCGLRDPDRWAPREFRLSYRAGSFPRPDAIGEADTLAYTMPPGAALWNALLTPHWVESVDGVAMSLNLSHGGLRLHGQLAPHEAELAHFRATHPDVAPQAFSNTY
jgi:hypothetical protein